jgi:hypothetical protein
VDLDKIIRSNTTFTYEQYRKLAESETDDKIEKLCKEPINLKCKDFFDRLDIRFYLPPLHPIFGEKSYSDDLIDLVFMMISKHYKGIQKIEASAVATLTEIVKNSGRRAAEVLIFRAKMPQDDTFRLHDIIDYRNNQHTNTEIYTIKNSSPKVRVGPFIRKR